MPENMKKQHDWNNSLALEQNIAPEQSLERGIAAVSRQRQRKYRQHACCEQQNWGGICKAAARGWRGKSASRMEVHDAPAQVLHGGVMCLLHS